MLQEWQKQCPLFQAFPAQFGRKHTQVDANRPSMLKFFVYS